MGRPQYTNKPFHEALGELLAERYADKLGRVSTGEFVGEVQKQWGKISRSYIYSQLRSERPLTTDFIEAAAKTLGISPHYFIEYRQAWIRWQMDAYPEITDRVHEVTMALVEQLRQNEEADKPAKKTKQAK